MIKIGAPQRMCVGCRSMKDKKTLLRVVRDPAGQIKLDPGQKAAGRGAYVCGEAECLKKMEKSRALSRAFKCDAGTEIYAEVRAYFEGGDS